MNNQKLINIVLATLVVVAIGVATYSVNNKENNIGAEGPRTAPTGNLLYINYDNIQLDNGIIDARAGTTTLTSFNGTTTGPIYYTIGATEFVTEQIPAIATTSVFCSITNPFGVATTSIDSIGSDIPTGLTYAINYTVSTSSTSVGSSTRALIYDISIPANSNSRDTLFWVPTIVASSSITATERAKVFSDIGGDFTFGKSPFILKPNERLNWRLSTSTDPAAQQVANLNVAGNCGFTGHKL